MTAAALPAAVLPRIGSLLRLLGSDQDGEVLGAARAIGRVLAGFGLTLHDLAAALERPTVEPEAPEARRPRKPQPDDVVLNHAERRAVVEALRRGLAGTRMSAWEREFAISIVSRLQGGSGRLSERQGEALRRLLDKVGEGDTWA